MRLREILNVTVLNQTKVKRDVLLVVLYGNPFVDAMQSKKQKNSFADSSLYSFSVLDTQDSYLWVSPGFNQRGIKR